MADGLTSALKLSRTNVHNISRKLKIQEFKAKIQHLTEANKAKSEEVERLQKRVVCTKRAKWRCRTATYRVVKQSKKTSTKVTEIQTELRDIKEQFMDKVDTLNSRVEELVGSLDKAQLERDTLATRVCELEATKVTTKQHNRKYRDSVRQSCMSDRHIVQKNFNILLENYRSQILPSIVSDWDKLSEEARAQLSTLNNFFCGMHLIVGITGTASSCLIEWERSEGVNTPQTGPILPRKSESGIVRLVRTACKALSKHGSEQSGVYQQFTTYLRSNGIRRNPLATFRGNRFNILFYDAGAVFYIAPLAKEFFKIWQTPNQLLKAVLADMEVSQYLAGCKALGLVN